MPLKLGMLNPIYFLMYCTGEKASITQIEGNYPQAPFPTREEREAFTKDFRKSFSGYMLRLSVRAGMTGWAQVHGLRGDSSLEERLRYDLEYIDRWSLLLDFEILIRTAGQVLIGKNAY